MNFKIFIDLMWRTKMKIFNKKNLLLSSAVVAGMLFTVGTKAVQADTTNDLQQETTDNNAKSNIQPRNKNESVQTQTLTIQKSKSR